MTQKLTNLSRRKFLGTGAAGAGAATLNILPSHVWAQSPNEKINVAFIGSGGRGAANIGGTANAGEMVYALCDVDQRRAAGSVKKYPKANFYADWREMLDKEGDKIDAVAVSTPDHLHAVAAMDAIKLGKHVYVEKPLTLTISEARALRKEANDRKLCTQMGNTGHAAEGARLTNEWIKSGSIGTVEEVHCRTNRPIWPQDLVRPAAEEVPPWMNWDLWLGPAPDKPYSSKIAPFNWRGYLDYGTGALGDMGAHIIDHPVWALGLGLPEKIEVEKADRKTSGSEKDSHPGSCIIHYYFAARGDQPPVKLTWYDGQYKIPKAEGMLSDKNTPGNGCVYLGSKHIMQHGSHGGRPEIVDTNRAEFKAPDKTEERSPGHYKEWFAAIREGKPAMAKSNFDVAVPLTETLLLGVIGSVLGPGTKFSWDPKKMTTGNADADQLVNHNYRDAWSL
ncbi:MAG: Gfo/Idh/MocA family oxidoreductase [Verrucomicrobiales bacterium]|nr:Gfo/Idh/MocA family oxidoreductase [Verrucomicrobiales bacterium]